MNKNKKNILICPLEWGLGHATRCIPIIKTLQNFNCKISIASEGRSGQLLKKEFPDLNHIYLPGYKIHYPSKNLMEISMLFQIPKIFYRIYLEHCLLNKIIKDQNIDIVLSDNRFGLWNKKTYSIYMTHQVLTKCPWFMKFMEYPLYCLHQFFINNYNECWVPDYKGIKSIAGDLSNKMIPKKKLTFIGPLSRLEHSESNTTKYDLLAIISGPEPQRSIFEKLITKHLVEFDKKALIVSGKSEGSNDLKQINKNILQVDFLNSSELGQAIAETEFVICRAGYSSIMDMIHLGKKAILIPTPGQTEQEYLAKYLSDKGFFPFMKQNNLQLDEILKKMEDYCPPKNSSFSDLNEKIKKLVHI